MNADYTQEELAEAVRALKSSIAKCEKARLKLKDGSPQKKWADRQLEAFYIVVSLIEAPYIKGQYTESELHSAGETAAFLIGKCENLPEKFKDGSPQKTLSIRRLKAFRIAAARIKEELGEEADSIGEDSP